MPNKPYALEWVEFARKNLETAQVLLEVDHYADIIGIELQQSIEKLFKAFLAYSNVKIPKEHDLVKLYYLIEKDITPLSESEIVLLRIATDYYKEDRYPNPHYTLPTREEVEEIFRFTYSLFEKMLHKMHIDEVEITKQRN